MIEKSEPSAIEAGMFHRIERKTLAQKIIEEITSYIDDNDVKSGSRLPSERELQEYFDVGRSTIRQALHALVALGILESKPGKGYYVRQIDGIPLKNSSLINLFLEEEDFFDMVEVREILERQIGALAAERATEQDIENIELALQEVKKAMQRGEDLIGYTTKVHIEIARATHNDMFVKIMEVLLPIIVSKAKKAQIPKREDYEQHKALAAGVASGDSKQATKIVSKHLGYLRDQFTKVASRKAGKVKSNKSKQQR